METFKKVNINDLLDVEQCEKKGFLDEIGVTNEKTKNWAIAVAVKSLIETLDSTTADIVGITSFLNEKIGDYFVSSSEKEAELEIVIQNLMRYLKYEKERNREILSRSLVGCLRYLMTEIQVTADLVFESATEIEVVKFKLKEPTLSYKARSFENKPENNIELYMMRELGQKLYASKGKPVVASYYYLKSKNDKKDFLAPVFEAKKGDNIITFDFTSDSVREAIEQRVETLLTVKAVNSASATCDKSNCDNCNFELLCNYEMVSHSSLTPVTSLNKGGKLTLSDDQKKIIAFDTGICRINAGAGAGKTTTISLRVAELIKKGYRPKDILMITFTNKGSLEMKEKIQYWLERQNINGVNIKVDTFNGFGEAIIQKEYARLGFTEPPHLIDKVARYDIILDILGTHEKIEGLDYKNPLLDFPNAKGCVIEMGIYFDKIKSMGYKNLADFAEDIHKPIEFAEKIWEFYALFNAELVKKNLILYQDQVNYLVQLLKGFPEVRKQYEFQHIIVDEYQDTDSLQIELLQLLIAHVSLKSLMVVGDDSQSIFGFRNCSQENILNFHKVFKNVQDIYLLDNYRSTPEIIEIANRLNRLNNNRIDKDLVSKKSSGKFPVLCRLGSVSDEYEYVVRLIEEKLQEGVEPEEIAIIARQKNELLSIKALLEDKNIPVVMDVPELVINNQNVQIILSFIKFFQNTELDLHLLEYLNGLMGDDLKNMTSAELKDFLSKQKDVILGQYSGFATPEEQVEFFYQMSLKLAETDNVVMEFIDLLEKKNFSDIDALATYLKKFALYKEDITVERDDAKYKAIVLTTAHSSKGKEFDVVINVIDKYKYDTEKMSNSEIEEERRLLFVSITRAKKELFITYSSNEDAKRNKGKYVQFVKELEDIMAS